MLWARLLPGTAVAEFSVGQAVTVRCEIYEPADECHPAGTLAYPGDRLVIRQIGTGEWPIKVSHWDYIGDQTFGVAASELRHLPKQEV